MKHHIRTVILASVFFWLLYLLAGAYKAETKRQELKADQVELLSIKYGLFNVDEWKAIMADVIAKKINEIEITKTNQEQMRGKISAFLGQTIGEFEKRYYQSNSGSILGIFSSGVASVTNIFGKMRENIPYFTDQIVHFLDDPANRNALKTYLVDKLNDYTRQTFAETDYTLHNQLLQKYGCKTRTEAIHRIESDLTTQAATINLYKNQILILAFLVFVYLLLPLSFGAAELATISAVCVVFLLLGVLLPMIEIDARIAELKMTLLGVPVQFSNQVLFYKSKSIVQVVQLMLLQSGWDIVAVGFLILLFSVLFPVSKLIGSLLYLFKPSVRQNRLLNFIVFKTGKWSMADVMVVALFMAYIGFSGIVGEQLRQLETLAASAQVITTNQSALQTGFYCFTAFALLSLLVSHRMKANLSQE